MKVLLIFTIFLVYCLIHAEISAYKVDSRCSDSFCQKYIQSGKCRALSASCQNNPNSTRFPYPDTCNCCKICIKHLGEGDVCLMGRPGTPLPFEMCGPGLQCIPIAQGNATCQRIISDCTKAQDLYDSRRKQGLIGMTEVRPECDGDGFYKPFHCIPGSLCYCVAPNGERIFGEIPHLHYEDEKKMTCGCSINAWKAQNTLDPQYKINAARCTEMGTYDQLQCMMGSNSTCLCVNAETGSPITEIGIVLEKDMDENHPPCFDKSRHTAGKYSTECETAYENYLNYLPVKTNDNENLIETDEPDCQPDGKFAKVQKSISGSKAICVQPDGRQTDAYEAEFNTPSGKIMDCNCARARWLLKSAGVVELPTCCSNGNFEAWQCRRNECFCVDKNGDQLGVEVKISDLFELECYKNREGNPCKIIT